MEPEREWRLYEGVYCCGRMMRPVNLQILGIPTSCHILPLSSRDIVTSPITRRSILVRRKQSSASAGLQTTGSFSLKDVLSTMGTP